MPIKPPTNTGPLRPEQVGSGVAELAALEQQRAAGAPARPKAAPTRSAAPRDPGARVRPEEVLTAAQARLRSEGWDVDGDNDEPEVGPDGKPIQYDYDDQDLDDVADLLEGKAPAEREAKPKKGKKPVVGEEQRQKALDRLKVPAKVRAILDDLPPEEVDEWLADVVKDQGKTDDALTERDRNFAALKAEVDALKASKLPQQGKPAAKPSNAKPKPGDQAQAEEGDQDEDLESLRGQDPEVAAALAKRDAKLKALEAENKATKAELGKLTAVHNADQAKVRRSTVEAAIKSVQDELGDTYPELHDLNQLRSTVAPRASALLKAGIHTKMEDAMREAAHAAYRSVAEDDRAALAARENPFRTPVSKVADNARTSTPKTMQRADVADMFVQLRSKHPDWSLAKVKSEVVRRARASKVIPDRPFIR